MATRTVVPFVPGHLDAFPAMLEGLRRLGISADRLSGPAWTVLRDGAPVACLGLQTTLPDCGELWLIAQDAEPMLTIAKTAKRLLRQHAGAYRRIQATARTDSPAAQRFLGWLGMQEEGVLHRYGVDGADHRLYATWRD